MEAQKVEKKYLKTKQRNLKTKRNQGKKVSSSKVFQVHISQMTSELINLNTIKDKPNN
jgi:hypothetical protein